jgi:hypothetical protein
MQHLHDPFRFDEGYVNVKAAAKSKQRDRKKKNAAKKAAANKTAARKTRAAQYPVIHFV